MAGNPLRESAHEKTLEFTGNTEENQGFAKRGRRGSNPQPPDRQAVGGAGRKQPQSPLTVLTLPRQNNFRKPLQKST